MESDALPRINRVIVTGFIQQTPELRHTPSGVPVSSFRVRTGRLVRDRRGSIRETVSTFTVVVWQDLAVRICAEAQIGQGVVVEGSLHSRSFVASNGERRTVLEVYADTLETTAIFLSTRELRGGGAGHEGEARPPERGSRTEEAPPPGEPHGEPARWSPEHEAEHQTGHHADFDNGHLPERPEERPEAGHESGTAEA